jgi:hypothetical protein
MSEPSAPKAMPSSSRLRMADQNRACRLLRLAIPRSPAAAPACGRNVRDRYESTKARYARFCQ